MDGLPFLQHLRKEFAPVHGLVIGGNLLIDFLIGASIEMLALPVDGDDVLQRDAIGPQVIFCFRFSFPSVLTKF